MKKNEITNKFKTGGLNVASFRYEQKSELILNDDENKKTYDQLFHKKVMSDYDKVTEVSYTHRERLREYFNMEVLLHSKGELIAQVKLFWILPDNRLKVSNWWLGQEVHISTLESMLQDFLRDMRQNNILVNEGAVVSYPKDKSTHKVDVIGINCTF